MTSEPLPVSRDSVLPLPLGPLLGFGLAVVAVILLATIFEPFHSSGPQSRSSGGLGLGLFIVNEFVKAHGGEVVARSDAESGTVFEVRLPRAARAATAGTLS